ncbi:class I SAM-dependent methyltransferase [Parasphingopyxis marina]|uniref:SAM-dependent methyltransferase n=1 Tax=Parasphingopyxis marina TaxID=2761622 RepID=A0A842HUU8_9SPHN|nr:SAM-dependent methyltransferase [Parasphingopyxis marina]MBC2776705.1 SAM-dependent methyltransferase [Parasphingopyxis marina]
MPATDGEPLGERLARLIGAEGPIPLAQYMAQANVHYYATRDPLGAEGDFVTAPEVSQMFGELVGLWLSDIWTRAGKPSNAHYVELGPGRGTLAEDALRAMRAVRFEPPIHLVETSPALRQSQAGRLPTARWHDDIDSLPETGPLFVIANEFFDALPIRQIQRGANGWHEVMVDWRDGTFSPVTSGPPLDALIPEILRDAPAGSIVETSPAVEIAARALAERIAKQGGTALIVDYGYVGPATGDTLQAVSRHGYADVFAEPGERDLTAHVDFTALGRIAKKAGLVVHRPIGQGELLESLGIGARTAALVRAAPHRQAELVAARDRLTSDGEMGRLFKATAWLARDWPEPAAF